jgi:signal transduction histidine kinase
MGERGLRRRTEPAQVTARRVPRLSSVAAQSADGSNEMAKHEKPARASPAAAPVEYSEVQTLLRAGRAVLGGVLLTLAAVEWGLGLPGSALKSLAAGLVMVHALLDRGRSPLPALTVTVGALAVTAGTPGNLVGPLAALAGCTLAASFVVLKPAHAAGPALALAVGAILRATLLAPPEVGGAATVLLGAAEAVSYLASLAVGGVAASRTIQRARQRQGDALEAEKQTAAMKNEFVSLVSHELRTPLTNIAGFAMTLRESWRQLTPVEVDEFLGVVCAEAEHLHALVDDILVVPRLEADRLLVEPTDFPLGPACFRIADLVFPRGGERSASVSVSGSAWVHADPNRVEQILRNLLENASKHGGAEVRLEASPFDAEWVITVTDDGPGVALEDRERIFAPFEQGSGGAGPGTGIGLGLTVSRALVEAMGGRIWYEPGFPTGARFCFTLPAAAPRPAAGAV